MTKATSDDSDESPGSYFSATYVGGTVARITRGDPAADSAQQCRPDLVPPAVPGWYVLHRSPAPNGRSTAVRPSLEQERLIEQQRGATSMAVELYRPVYINT